MELHLIGPPQEIADFLGNMNAGLKQRIDKLILFTTNRETHTMAAIDDLEAAVAKNTTVTGSALVLIQGLKGLLDAAIAANAAGDPTKLAALSAKLGADDQALADAVVVATPAA